MHNKQELLDRITALGPWFYDFDAGDVRIASKLPDNIRGIHETRRTMVNAAAETFFGSELRNVRCLDIGCHEGFFSLSMAPKVMSVRGVDIREESLTKANLARELLGAKNVEFGFGDCYKLGDVVKEPYDLTLFLGVLYHLDNPLGALRCVSRATKSLCILETQVIDEVTGTTEWGSRDWNREYQGVVALIDETPEYDKGNPEAGSSGFSFCPSLSAVHAMLRSVGFKHSEVIKPPENGYEQHVRGKRVVVAATK